MDEQRDRPPRGGDGPGRKGPGRQEPGRHDAGGKDGVLFTPSSLRRRRRDGPKRAMLLGGGLLLLLLVAAGAWFFLRSGGEPDPGESSPATAADVEPGTPDTSSSAGAREAPVDLPELEASDERIREMAASLSERPRWAEWLVTDDLARRFVASVVSVSAGASPSEHLEFMEPDEPFQVREAEEGIYVAPESYRRYDLPTAVFASLDTEGSVELYRRLRPLFEEAHQELGFPEGSFEDALARAVDHLLAVEVPEGPVAVEPGEALYEFGNPRLENLSEAQKHLLRLGPENARRVQEKLQELSRALGLGPGGGS